MPRILVVDDDLALRELIAHFLRGQNYEVRVEGSAEDALRALRGQTFDLLIVDLVMPRAGGLELLAQARALGLLPHARVVLMTGLVNAATGELVATLVDHVLEKPFRREQLVSLVEGLLWRGPRGSCA